MRRAVGLLACVAVVLVTLTAGSAAAQQPPDPSQTIVVPPPGQAAPDAQQQPAPAPSQTVTPPPSPSSPSPRRKEAKPEKEWYGWQTLAADGAAAALMIAGQATGVYSIFDVGFGAYLLAPPVVHVVHNNAGQAFGSLGLRLVSPWVGVAIGVTVGLFFLSSTPTDPNTCHADTFLGVQTGSQTCDKESAEILLFHTNWATPLAYGFNVGLIGGYLLAIGIDAGLIAYEKVDDAEYGKLKKRDRDRRWYTVAPSFDLGRTHGSLGLRGTF